VAEPNACETEAQAAARDLRTIAASVEALHDHARPHLGDDEDYLGHLFEDLAGGLRRQADSVQW
jgi:hypothetical protein